MLRFFEKIKKQSALKGLMKLNFLRETLLLTMSFHYKVRKNQQILKGPSFESAHGFLNWLSSLRRQMPYIFCFLYCFSCSLFFGCFLLLLERETKFTKFWTKFWIKRVTLVSSRCISLPLHSKPVQRNMPRFFKNFKKQCVV